MKYTLRLRIKGEDWFFGPGVARLLRAIEQTGGLKSAAAQMNMAYSKACRILKTAERELGFSLTHSKIGGIKGGGSTLTEEAIEFLERYENFQKDVYLETDKIFKTYFGDFKNNTII